MQHLAAVAWTSSEETVRMQLHNRTYGRGKVPPKLTVRSPAVYTLGAVE
jgi:hypothetical protein